MDLIKKFTRKVTALMMEAVEDSLTQNFIRNEIKNFATFCEI
jgi:hypothetical protein